MLQQCIVINTTMLLIYLPLGYASHTGRLHLGQTNVATKSLKFLPLFAVPSLVGQAKLLALQFQTHICLLLLVLKMIAYLSPGPWLMGTSCWSFTIRHLPRSAALCAWYWNVQKKLVPEKRGPLFYCFLLYQGERECAEGGVCVCVCVCACVCVCVCVFVCDKCKYYMMSLWHLPSQTGGWVCVHEWVLALMLVVPGTRWAEHKGSSG